MAADPVHSDPVNSDPVNPEETSPYADLDGDPGHESPGHGAGGPPHGLGRSLLVAAGAFVAAALLFLDPFAWHGLDEALRGGSAASADGSATAPETLYSCSMHPQIMESEPGTCPICGMDLTPVAAGAEAQPDHAGHDHGGSEELFTCPMHPMILEPETGPCPICGMDLVPAANEEPDGAASTGNGAPELDEATGVAISIDPSVIQKMNVRVETVEKRVVDRNVRSVGYLSYDPQRMVTVTTKYPGFVEKVFVHQVGENVRAGAPLFEIYAPELVQTQQELLSAVRYARRLGDAPQDVKRRADELVDAARERMAYWDVPEPQIERLVETEQIFRTVTVYATAGGVVMKRLDGLEGMAVRPGMELFHLADLSILWMSVELFEDQLGWVGPGTQAEVQLSYFPEQSFGAAVRFFDPSMDPSTRTLSVRLEVPNPDRRLRVGMYADVMFVAPESEPVPTVPAQAVLRTGERQVVVVAVGDGHFAPRQVELGRSDGEWVEVSQGLQEGERVVTSAQFLIDSESNLRAAIQKLLKDRAAATDEPTTGPPENQPDVHADHADHSNHRGHS